MCDEVKEEGSGERAEDIMSDYLGREARKLLCNASQCPFDELSVAGKGRGTVMRFRWRESEQDDSHQEQGCCDGQHNRVSYSNTCTGKRKGGEEGGR